MRLLEASVRALLAHLEYCGLHGELACSDPPLFTTGLLEALGYRGYGLRRVLAEAREAGPVPVYVSPYSRFMLAPSYRLGEARYDASSMVPLDLGDCLRVAACRVAPRTSVFSVYLEGGHGGERVRLNVVYLAVLLERRGFPVSRLTRGVLGCLTGSEEASVEGLDEMLSLAYSVVRVFLPDMLQGPGELLRYSPGLRMLMELLSGRGCLPERTV